MESWNVVQVVVAVKCRRERVVTVIFAVDVSGIKTATPLRFQADLADRGVVGGSRAVGLRQVARMNRLGVVVAYWREL